MARKKAAGGHVQATDAPDSLKTIVGLGKIVAEIATAFARLELSQKILEVPHRANSSDDAMPASDTRVVC